MIKNKFFPENPYELYPVDNDDDSMLADSMIADSQMGELIDEFDIVDDGVDDEYADTALKSLGIDDEDE